MYVHDANEGLGECKSDSKWARLGPGKDPIGSESQLCPQLRDLHGRYLDWQNYLNRRQTANDPISGFKKFREAECYEDYLRRCRAAAAAQPTKPALPLEPWLRGDAIDILRKIGVFSTLPQRRTPTAPQAPTGFKLHGTLGEAAATASPCPATRKMVRVGNALAAPYRCICRIVARAYDKPENAFSVGTGFLISPYHVLTCAHNIYPVQAPHTKTIDIYPAQNGPDDKVVRFRANGWAVSGGWRPKDCRTSGEDYGIIRLASPTAHDFFQLRPFDPAILAGQTVHLAGYPSSDSEPAARLMFESTGSITGAVVIEECGEVTMRGVEAVSPLRGRLLPSILPSTSLVAHDLTSAPSMSGSPMWVEQGGARTLVGIHERRIFDQRGCITLRIAVLLNNAVRAQAARWMSTDLPPLRR
jgi:V8-like Glu-specific endopeptidase